MTKIVHTTEQNVKPLISLEEHNRQMSAKYRAMYDPRPRPNQIACPQCGQELLDTDPLSRLLSSPPKKHVHCDSCSFKGYRIA